MKQIKLLFLLLYGVLICACSSNEPNFPNTPSTGGTSGSSGNTETIVQPTATFIFTTQQPLRAVFTNKSKDAKSYVWDFGDGSTSTETNPIHKYKTKGVYEVVLTAKNGTETDTYSTIVTIKEPTKCYVASCEFVEIPKNNEYYCIKVTDSYSWGGPTYYFNSSWYLLSSVNIPKECTSSIDVEMKYDNPSKGYYVSLWQNSKSSGNGTQLYRWYFKQSTLYSDFPDGYTFTSDNGKGKVTVWFEWK